LYDVSRNRRLETGSVASAIFSHFDAPPQETNQADSRSVKTSARPSASMSPNNRSRIFSGCALMNRHSVWPDGE